MRLSTGRFLSCTVIPLLASCSHVDPEEATVGRSTAAITAASASEVLGAESTGVWSVNSGQLIRTTAQKTQGGAALELQTPSWMSITSAPFSASGLSIGQYFAIDLLIPNAQTDPFWNGRVEAFVSIPSASVVDLPLGAPQTLSGRSHGKFHTIAWKLSSKLRAALAQQPSDVSLRFNFTLPQHQGNYVLDNLRFDFQPPGQDYLSVFGFEDPSEFTASAALSTSTTNKTDGNASLGVAASGYTTINTRPMFTGGLTSTEQLMLQVYLPPTQSNPTWFGDVQISASIPSAGIDDQYLGWFGLTGLKAGEFNTVSVNVPDNVKYALRTDRADLQFRIIVNVPSGNGTYYLDQLRFAGPAITPERTNTLAINQSELRTQLNTAGSGGSVSLSLFPDVTAVLSNIQTHQSGAVSTFVGDLAAPLAGRGYISVSDDGAYGILIVEGKVYELLGSAAGTLRVIETNKREYPPELEATVPTSFSWPGAIGRTSSSTGSAGTIQQPLMPNPQLDVLVLYTTAAAAKAGGAGNLQTHAEGAGTLANEAYERSGINQRVKIVHVEEIAYTESGDFGTDLDRLKETNDGWFDDIHALRDRYGADLVALFIDNDESCGKANLAVVSSDADDDSAFSVVHVGCVGSHSFAHELGHISGAHHDTHADPSLLPAYAHGFVSTEGKWRTIMAYDEECQDSGFSCERIGYFSTPNKTNPKDGRTLGNETWSNNVKRLNETAITLEGFRLDGPRVSLYEGNDGTQDHVCVVSTESDAAINFTESSDFRYCDNDEARSLKLFNVPAGRVLRLYDDPTGGSEDDWVQIIVKRDITEKLVGSFEQFFEDNDIAVVPHLNNGLDGKVSRLVVASAPLGATIDLHEGNNATQDLVCSVGIAQSVDYNFQDHADCDNDEARSATLVDVPAGTVIRLYDSPSGSREDDWTEIYVTRYVRSLVVGTFENTMNNADIQMIYHRNNGLDGKVSRLEVDFKPVGATVDFYEGNNGSQNLVCSLGVAQPVSVNFQDHAECDNDEARSLRMLDIPAGTVLFLYDSPDGNREDDWVFIEALSDVKNRTIDTFQTDITDSEIRMLYFGNNGLDGKVSRFESTTASTLPGILSFYEGNSGTQNKVCDITGNSQVVRFKSSDACDNDEARSLTLSIVSAGTKIGIYDDPDCQPNDDWTEIEAKRPIARVTVNTFEQSLENDDVKVTHYHDNGLDGKVSCVRIVKP